MSHVATMETPRGPMVATQYYFIGELYGHNFIKTTNMSADRVGEPHKAHDMSTDCGRQFFSTWTMWALRDTWSHDHHLGGVAQKSSR